MSNIEYPVNFTFLLYVLIFTNVLWVLHDMLCMEYTDNSLTTSRWTQQWPWWKFCANRTTNYCPQMAAIGRRKRPWDEIKLIGSMRRIQRCKLAAFSELCRHLSHSQNKVEPYPWLWSCIPEENTFLMTLPLSWYMCCIFILYFHKWSIGCSIINLNTIYQW